MRGAELEMVPEALNPSSRLEDDGESGTAWPESFCPQTCGLAIVHYCSSGCSIAPPSLIYSGARGQTLDEQI